MDRRPNVGGRLRAKSGIGGLRNGESGLRSAGADAEMSSNSIEAECSQDRHGIANASAAAARYFLKKDFPFMGAFDQIGRARDMSSGATELPDVPFVFLDGLCRDECAE